MNKKLIIRSIPCLVWLLAAIVFLFLALSPAITCTKSKNYSKELSKTKEVISEVIATPAEEISVFFDDDTDGFYYVVAGNITPFDSGDAAKHMKKAASLYAYSDVDIKAETKKYWMFVGMSIACVIVAIVILKNTKYSKSQ